MGNDCICKKPVEFNVETLNDELNTEPEKKYADLFKDKNDKFLIKSQEFEQGSALNPALNSQEKVLTQDEYETIRKNYENDIKNYEQFQRNNDNDFNNQEEEQYIGVNFQGEPGYFADCNPNMKPRDEFSRYIFDRINEIRTNPRSFVANVEEGRNNVFKDKRGHIIYKEGIKVSLNRGKEAFDEVIRILENTNPMDPLVYCPKLNVPLPADEEEINDKNYLTNKCTEIIHTGVPIKSFWRDVIPDPKISFLLMIVDNTGNKKCLKRSDILDPNMKYIGINSIALGNSFVCYISFSDSR